MISGLVQPFQVGERGDILHNQAVLFYIECGVACNAPEYKPPIRHSASLLTAVALASEQRGVLTHPALWQ